MVMSLEVMYSYSGVVFCSPPVPVCFPLERHTIITIIPAMNPVGSVTMKIPGASIHGIVGQDSVDASTAVGTSVVES